MRFIKTYIEKANESNSNNILNRFSKEQILDMFQELRDDFYFEMKEEDIHTCKILERKDKNYLKDSSFIAYNYLNKNQFYVSYSPSFSDTIENCYELELVVYDRKFSDSKAEFEKLKDILDHKKDTYGIDYIISEKRYDIYQEFDLIDWSIFLY